MHAILSLLKGDIGRGLKHLFGHFHTVGQVRITRGDVLADLGFAVVERRQAVHE